MCGTANSHAACSERSVRVRKSMLPSASCRKRVLPAFGSAQCRLYHRHSYCGSINPLRPPARCGVPLGSSFELRFCCSLCAYSPQHGDKLVELILSTCRKLVHPVPQVVQRILCVLQMCR
mmetsp:Transcript_39301/g.108270  ORF Transcript_39301/g.108270 Transcript_39301/m.108270 type:complete len:120 (-) Transcript_39301:36-395(-)